MATIRKRNERWHVQIRRKGHKSLTRSFLAKSDAQIWARQTEAELDRAPLVRDREQLDHTTFGDLLRRYRAEVTPRKRGYATEFHRIDRMLARKWSSTPLAQVTPAVFSSYRDERAKHVSDGTIIRELGLLRAIFEVARRDWDIPIGANPVADIRKPKAPQGRERRVSAQELAVLLRQAEAARTPWLAPVIQFAIETGMRKGELVAMEWCDLDLPGCILRIPVTKTGIGRRIPLSPRAMAIISALNRATGDEGGAVFKLSSNALHLAWTRCRSRAQKECPSIADLRFHDLRHEAVSRFFELGLSTVEVALISGHRDLRMLHRYTHLKPEHILAKLQSAVHPRITSTAA